MGRMRVNEDFAAVKPVDRMSREMDLTDGFGRQRGKICARVATEIRVKRTRRGTKKRLFTRVEKHRPDKVSN